MNENDESIKRREVVQIKHVQTLLQEEDYRKVKILAMDLGIPLKDMIVQLILTGYQATIKQLTKEKEKEHGKERKTRSV